jgi:UDP-2,3-diacylglucosamine hydrolase
MMKVVFISDLHLSKEDPVITKRFFDFTKWAEQNTKQIYILGDFFHVWAGDVSLDDWSKSIAERLSWLCAQGINIFYMHGNRDFLLGSDFANLANLTILDDPYVINLNNEPVLLTHGDQYCTKDKGHQWLRRLTRNSFFPSVFKIIPLKFRNKLVMHVRNHSKSSPSKPASTLEIVTDVMLKDMNKHGVKTIIHGHIHKPGINYYQDGGQKYRQIVLSDWDATPQILCFNDSDGLYFKKEVSGV